MSYTGKAKVWPLTVSRALRTGPALILLPGWPSTVIVGGVPVMVRSMSQPLRIASASPGVPLPPQSSHPQLPEPPLFPEQSAFQTLFTSMTSIG